LDEQQFRSALKELGYVEEWIDRWIKMKAELEEFRKEPVPFSDLLKFIPPAGTN
jgi:hypothetical protein